MLKVVTVVKQIMSEVSGALSQKENIVAITPPMVSPPYRGGGV
jgi:hypothetical protein